MYFARLFGESLLFCSQPNQSVQGNKKENAPVVDHRSVDDLLTFINGQVMEEEGLRTNSKAQKRARQKQKKVSELFVWLVGLLANGMTDVVQKNVGEKTFSSPELRSFRPAPRIESSGRVRKQEVRKSRTSGFLRSLRNLKQ